MVTTPFRVVELFAGDGKLGKTAHYAHMSTAQLDICMGRSSWRRTRKAFDLLTPEGIASTDCMWRRAFFSPQPCLHFWVRSTSFPTFSAAV